MTFDSYAFRVTALMPDVLRAGPTTRAPRVGRERNGPVDGRREAGQPGSEVGRMPR